MASGRFDGRVALVTGAATGIGFEVARRVASEGGMVAVLDINGTRATDAVGRLGANAIGLAANVADEPSMEAAVRGTVARFGQLDILVNSAGITGPNAKLEDYAAEDWRQVMDVNINGTFFACKSAVPHMRQGGYGRIVNISSIAGKEGNPHAAAYSASKAAVLGLTKSLSKELADTEIRVNAVTPAAVRTEIFDQMSQAHIDFMLSKIPLGRFGKVEEVASLVCWLASEECSFSTGAVFDLSGGRATY